MNGGMNPSYTHFSTPCIVYIEPQVVGSSFRYRLCPRFEVWAVSSERWVPRTEVVRTESISTPTPWVCERQTERNVWVSGLTCWGFICMRGSMLPTANCGQNIGILNYSLLALAHFILSFTQSTQLTPRWQIKFCFNCEISPDWTYVKHPTNCWVDFSNTSIEVTHL